MEDRHKESNVERLRTGILDMIRELDLSLGDKLPTEKTMTERFQVSRPTLREALKLLEQDAIIDVHQGKGRFVAAGSALSIARPITKFESVSDMVRSHGYTAQTQLLGFVTQPANADIARNLGLAEGTAVIRVERLRRSAGQPLIYSIDWVPRALLGADVAMTPDWSASLVSLLGRFNHDPVASTANVYAVPLPKDIVELHGLEDFGPALLIEEVCFATDGTRVIYAKDYHRGSAFSFSFIRK